MKTNDIAPPHADSAFLDGDCEVFLIKEMVQLDLPPRWEPVNESGNIYIIFNGKF